MKKYKFKSPDKDVTVIPWRSKSVEEWELQRQEIMAQDDLSIIRFGSSETGVYCGVNKYQGKFEFFRLKVGKGSPMQGSIRMLTGNYMEPHIADIFKYYHSGEDIKTQEKSVVERMKSNTPLREVYKAEYFLLNSKYPNLFSSLDYVMPKEYGCPLTGEVLETDAVIEIKNIGWSTHQSFINEGISLYYFAQVQQQMLVSGLRVAYLVTFVENSNLHVYRIDFDPEWGVSIDENAKDMAYRVLAYKNIEKALSTPLTEDEREILLQQQYELEPEVDALESTTTALKEAYYQDDSEIIYGDSEDEALCIDYIQYGALEKEAKDNKTLTKNKLLQRLKTAYKMEVESEQGTYTVKGGSKFSCTFKERKK